MWFFHQSIRNPRGSEKSNGISNKVNLGDATGTGCWVYRQRTKRPLAGSRRELQGAGTGRASAAALSQERPTCNPRGSEKSNGISNKVNLGDATGTGCWVYRQRTKRPLAGSRRELQGAGTGRASAAA